MNDSPRTVRRTVIVDLSTVGRIGQIIGHNRMSKGRSHGFELVAGRLLDGAAAQEVRARGLPDLPSADE
jgi:hypothetical protein